MSIIVSRPARIQRGDTACRLICQRAAVDTTRRFIGKDPTGGHRTERRSLGPHYAEAQRNSRRADHFWSPFSDSVSSSHWSKAHRAQSYCRRHSFGISIVPSRTWRQSLASRAKDLPLFPKVASIVFTSLRVESTRHGLSATWLNHLYCNRNARRSSKTHNFLESLPIRKKGMEEKKWLPRNRWFGRCYWLHRTRWIAGYIKNIV